MEEQMSANQSAEVIETVETPIETPVSTESEAPVTTQETPAAPEGIRVKYNKEERVIGIDEAPTWIQKGLNYDKVQERSSHLEQQINRFESAIKNYGYNDVDAYLQAVDKDLMERRIREEAEKLGVSEDFIRDELQPLRSELDRLKQAEKDLKMREFELQINNELREMRSKHHDFDTYEDKVFDLVKNHGYNLNHAYMIATYEDKLANAAKAAEADTIRKLRDNELTSTGALGADAPEEKTGYNAMSREERRAFRERVKRG